jgi:hypothetical protein
MLHAFVAPQLGGKLHVYGLFKAGVKRVGIWYEAEWPQSHNWFSERQSSPCPCQEGKFIFNLGTTWEWVVNYTPRPLYPQEGTPVSTEQDAVGPRAGLDDLEKAQYHKILFPVPRIEPQDRPIRSLVAMPNTPVRFPITDMVP